MPDAVLKHLHLEDEGGGAEQPVHIAKFSTGTVFDVHILLEGTGEGEGIKWGTLSLCLCLCFSPSFSISLIPFFGRRSEREYKGKDRIDYYTCS